MDPYFAERTIEDDNGCWIWTGCVTNVGYGQAAGGKPAHRRSYEVHVGPIPDGLLIRHLCDTPLCCNPLHLIPGNTSQNWFDMTEEKRKKRQQRKRKHQPEQITHITIETWGVKVVDTIV